MTNYGEELMASMRQRAKVSRRLWSTIRSLASRNITLENDSLGTRYSVNAWGIAVRHRDAAWLQTVQNRLVESLLADGWTSEPVMMSIFLSRPDTDVRVALSRPYADPSRGQTFTIGVY